MKKIQYEIIRRGGRNDLVVWKRRGKDLVGFDRRKMGFVTESWFNRKQAYKTVEVYRKLDKLTLKLNPVQFKKFCQKNGLTF